MESQNWFVKQPLALPGSDNYLVIHDSMDLQTLGIFVLIQESQD